MKIDLKVLNENAIIPKTGSSAASGADLYACLNSDKVEIKPHETLMVHTGIAVAIPVGYFGGIFARSGLASKKGLRPANCVGVIDPDYRGELIVALHNDTNEVKVIDNHERVAQLLIIPYITPEFDVKNKLDDTERGSGGFGSTGKL